MKNGISCSTCVFFDKQGSPTSTREGYCRSKPPTLEPTSLVGLWPGVLGSDWCGTWKPTPESAGLGRGDTAREEFRIPDFLRRVYREGVK